MNNKELTELKKEFIEVIRKNTSFDGLSLHTENVWKWLEPHLKSNDEIKREAVENFKDWVINRQTEDGYKYKMWYEYIEEYLTQKENNE